MFEPARHILDFINRQPPTVRKNLQRDVVQGFRDHEALRTSSLETLVSDVMSEVEDTAAFWRCIHVVGVLDHSLSLDFRSIEQFQRNIPTEYLAESPMMRKLALEAPLRRRYFVQAAAEWRELRASTFSSDAFRQYMQDHLLMLPPELRQREVSQT